MFSHLTFPTLWTVRHLFLALVAALVWPSTAAEAKNLYVNATAGNDATSYATNGPNAPWRTIGRAAWGSTNRDARVSSEAARAGDVVLVAAGTYSTVATNQRATPSLYTQNQGTPGNPIVFRADGLVTITQSGVGMSDENGIVRLL